MNDETQVDEKDEQTAVADDTNDAPKKGASEEGGAAQDDEGDGLDALLAEFEERQTAQKPGDSKPEPKSDTKDDGSQIDVSALAALEERLNQQEAREQRRQLDKLFTNMSDGTNGDEVDAEAFLNAVAARRPQLVDIYNNRAQRPDLWAKAERELKRDFTKRYGKKVDKQATEGRGAIESAVRSAQSAAPVQEHSADEIMTASPDEWAKMQRKLGITPL